MKKLAVARLAPPRPPVLSPGRRADLRHGHWLLGLLVSTTLACQAGLPHSPPDVPTFTDPIAVTVPASADLPAVTIFLAFDRGATGKGLVEPVGSSVYKALKACGQVVEALRRGGDAQVALSVEDGRVSAETPTLDDESSRCLAAALGGDRLATPSGMTLHVRARVAGAVTDRRTP